MKSPLAVALLLALPFALRAQLVVPTDIVPKPGDFYSVHQIVNPEAIVVGDSGINQTWDFTAVQYADSLFEYYEVTSAAGTPYEAMFPTCNLVEKYYANNEPGNVRYNYYRLNDTTLDFHLHGLKSSATSQVYNDPILLTHFPFGYNNISSDAFCFDSNGGSGAQNVCGFAVLKFDGVGTLKLPYGVYGGVYRFRYYDESVEASATDDTLRNTRYYWYMPGVHHPLLTQNTFEDANGNVVLTARILSASSTNPVVETQDAVNVHIFPNPTADNILIETTKPYDAFQITSADGRKVLNRRANALKQIDLSGLSRGVYCLSILFDGKVVRKTLVKL